MKETMTEKSAGGTRRFPPWLHRSLSQGSGMNHLRGLLRELELHTVCESARCPNISECFSKGTATFMILGDICTRRCGFCAIGQGRPLQLDPEEPLRLAEAVAQLGLQHVVVTSVARDDLNDGGADHFSRVIEAIRKRNPEVRIEVLIPDFRGSESALEKVLMSQPDILNHNIETVPRLYSLVRPQADYRRSLELLINVKKRDPIIWTKSGLMLGLGESMDEVLEVLKHLRLVECQMLTIGQYLQPDLQRLPVVEYIPPSQFEWLKKKAYQMGFSSVASGPLVRSSYHAQENFSVTNC